MNPAKPLNSLPLVASQHKSTAHQAHSWPYLHHRNCNRTTIAIVVVSWYSDSENDKEADLWLGHSANHCPQLAESYGVHNSLLGDSWATFLLSIHFYDGRKEEGSMSHRGWIRPVTVTIIAISCFDFNCFLDLSIIAQRRCTQALFSSIKAPQDESKNLLWVLGASRRIM